MKTPRSNMTQSASVLIVVMIACLGLVSLTLVFGRSMLMAYRGVDNGMAGAQAQAAIEGGVRYAQYLMKQVSRPGAMPDTTIFQGDELTVGEGTFWFIGEPSATDPVDEPAWGLVDEASKLNLNTATSAMLRGLPGMTEAMADAIVAWRTAASGSAAAASTTTKNAAFETVDELALVTGTDAALLYGQDTNLNHVLDPNETESVVTMTTASRIPSGLLEYVTVFSREPNTRSDGTARANVTQTSSSALANLLRQRFGAAREAAIMGRLRAAGTIRSVLEFHIRGGLSESEFEQISGDITARSGAFVTGLVNVNTASQTVLACLPGIGSDKAAQLVSARAGWSSTPSNCLWVIPILGEEGAVAAGPYLTASGYQVSADIAAVGHDGRGYRRTRFVIDTSTGSPRIVYRRDLGALGWALGGEVRRTLALKKQKS